MSSRSSRRQFLRSAAAVGAGLSAPFPLRTAPAADAPSNKLVIGVMGTAGRGTTLATTFASIPGAEVKYVCDVDDDHLAKAARELEKRQQTKPEAVKDFRRILDDKSVDAIVIAAPDHWHAPAAVLACAAGKHVYVEKPCCHNPREGELLVEAARKHKRVVQHGSQRRSWAKVAEAVRMVRAGEVGPVRFCRGWYNARRGTIGRGKPATVPATLDYALWQGPAPERPYRDNLIHYNWHWFWHWGTGEMGNNGIHSLDVCRWGLGVDAPRRVTSGGGRYHFDDDQETPDTQTVTFDFGDKLLVWEGRSCHPRGVEGSGFGIAFYGDKGTIVIDGNDYKLSDPDGKPVRSASGSAGDAGHVQNFLDCIRTGGTPNAEIEEGVKSVLLCHLGNIAHRTGRTINLDPRTGKIVGDAEAAALWGREYRPGWEPNV